ncbi:MAG: DNA-3-methyladenine glycosylase I [Eubacteriales bacterium]|nr:DNA-3-methyladenine glycosylase I [Eubacteriales bacterium]
MEQNRRCSWVNEQSELYCKYHDEEWGTPIRDDAKMYELFLLELFQAGLSWVTILKKREAFRAAFDGFDVEKIARYGEEKIGQLLMNADIIRSRRKIEAAVVNARAVLEIQREYGSFCRYLWSFSNGKVIRNPSESYRTVSKLSDRITEDMKRRGIRYAGSVTIYSFLQAAGMINDHETACFRCRQLLEETGMENIVYE